MPRKTWRMFAHCLPNHNGVGTWFAHITSSQFQTRLYNESEPIVAVLCEEAEDGDYYGWEDSKGSHAGSLSMTYPSYALHSMCFTYGPKVEEEAGKGRTVRLRVTLVGGE
jgi:hypothetical protein